MDQKLRELERRFESTGQKSDFLAYTNALVTEGIIETAYGPCPICGCRIPVEALQAQEDDIEALALICLACGVTYRNKTLKLAKIRIDNYLKDQQKEALVAESPFFTIWSEASKWLDEQAVNGIYIVALRLTAAAWKQALNSLFTSQTCCWRIDRVDTAITRNYYICRLTFLEKYRESSKLFSLGKHQK